MHCQQVFGRVCCSTPTRIATQNYLPLKAQLWLSSCIAPEDAPWVVISAKLPAPSASSIRSGSGAAALVRAIELS